MASATPDDELDASVPAGKVRRSPVEIAAALDRGLDPYTGQPVNIGGVGSLVVGRNTNRMLEGLIPQQPGTRRLYDGNVNKALSLDDGSGSVYDDLNAGGYHQRVPRSLSGDVFGGQVSRADKKKIDAPSKADRKQEIEYAEGEGQRAAQNEIGRYQQMQKEVGPELTTLFSHLPEAERARVLQMPPELRLGTLQNHPLRGTMFPASGNPARRPPGNSMYPTINPRGVNSLRPTASLLNDEMGGTQLPEDGDYFARAGLQYAV